MIIFKRTGFLLLLIVSISLLFACSPKNEIEDTVVQTPPANQIQTPSSNNLLQSLILTTEEEKVINALKEKGVLSVATTETKGTYQFIDGQEKGYSYAIAAKLAQDLSIPLEVKVIDNFQDFFKYNNQFDSAVQTDASIVYSPDLLEEVDIYIDMLTPLPWREKLMHIIKILPIREVILSSKDTKIQSYEDLDGLTVAISPVTSFYTTLQETAIKQHITIDYHFTTTVTESIDAIESGQADFTIMDSNLAFLEVDSNPSLQVGMPITDIKHLGWAVKKDNQAFASIIEKYWNALKTSGEFNKMWLEDYQANYFDYYKFITSNLNAIDTISFSDEEWAYIRRLQDKGTLKIALQESKVCIHIVDGEHRGFNYLLAKNLADSLGVELDTTIVGEFTTYFWENGQTPAEIKTDPSFTYTPDYLKEVDIYTDNITHLPWRQQIFNQIAIVPAKAVFVLHKNSPIQSIKDLNNKAIAINRDTSFEVILQDLIKEHNLTVEILDVTTDGQGYDAVNDKVVDATMIDSDLGLLILQDYDNLVISFSASEISNLGWAVKKEDDILASILTKYIDATKQNGQFERFWNKTYDISYIEYLRLLSD